MNVVALLQCVLAAKNAKGAKELGVGFAPSVCTLSAPCDLFLAWRTGDTGEQLLFSPASPALPAEFYIGFAMVLAAKNAKLAKELGLRPVRLHALRGQSLNDILTMR